MKYVISFIILIISIGCTQNEKMTFDDYFDIKSQTFKNILIDSIELDSINLEKINSSYYGQLQIFNDKLYFIDSKFCWVFIFNLNGDFLSKKLGQGRGPNELPVKSIDSFCFLPEGNKIILGSSSDYYIVNSQWEIISKNTFDLDYHNTIRNNPENPSTYTFDYENLYLKSDTKNYIYIPVYAETEFFNPFMRSYYKDSRILLKVDYKRNTIDGVYGRRSPQYLNYNFLPQFAYFHFDVDDQDNKYISYDIDSTIFVYNDSFRPIKAFGFQGKDMNTDYTELSIPDIKQFRSLYFNERPGKGYYNWIKYFDERKILFRSYKKNASISYDGLQIYKSDTLIADISVPKNFKVIGYSKSYFYSNAYIDEYEGEIKVFMFNLNY